MKISRSSKIRFLGFSLILVVALGIVVNIATANTPQTGREEISVSVEQPNLAQEVTPEVPDVPQFTQTSCAMALDDLGDGDPLSYLFSAVNTNNIASYAWDFDTANPGTLTGAGASVNFSYPGAGSYNIQLTCTPIAGFGAPIVLTGSVFVSQPPSPGFTLSPGTVVNSGVPVMFSTTNTTTPLSSTYEWCVTPVAIPPTTFDGANCPVFFDTTTNISFMFGTFATTHYVYLRATNAGDSAIAALSFVLNATAPSANFSVTPATGPAPLNVSIDGTDFATGPLFPGAAGWQYTITYPDTSTTTETAQDFNLSSLPAGLYTIRLDYAGPGGSGFVQRSVLVYTSAEEVEARFIVVMGDNVGADRRVCFINTSGGPVVNSYWDFDGDGTPDILALPAITSDMPEGGDPNANTVCYIYPAASFNTNINVKLIVVGSDPLAVNSEAIQTINIIAKPEADFTWNPVNPVWGQFVDFTDASTGVIDEYFWEFDHNNNGSIDGTSTTQNPQNIQLPVGVNRVILTVRNTVTGDFDTVEYLVTVTRRDISCNAIGGTFIINPSNANPQNYTSSVSGTNGPDFGTRTLTYDWTINGTPAGSSANLTGVDWTTFGFGTHTIGLTVTTSDGATCYREQTVNFDWQPVTCSDMGVAGPFVSGGSPYTFVANNSPVTFSQNVNAGSLNGRPILSTAWEVLTVPGGAVVDSGSGNTFNRSWVNPGASYQETIRYTVFVDNNGNGGAFEPGIDASCFEDELITIVPFVNPTCSLNSPWASPQYADGGAYNLNVTPGNLQNRTVVEYRWYITDPVPGAENPVPVQSGLGTGYVHNMTTDYLTHPDFSYRVVIRVDNGDGSFTENDCTTGTVGVQPYPTPTCTIGGNNTNAPNTNTNRLPEMASTTNAQERQNFNMNLNLNGLSGITLGNRTWSYPVNAAATIFSGGTLTDSNVTLIWNASQASIAPGNPATIDLFVEWTYPNGDPGSINCTDRNINVFVPALVCNPPTGDLTPLPLDNNTYSINLTNVGGGTASPLYGRNHYTQWSLEVYTGAPGGPYDVNNNALWTPVGGSPFTTASTPASQQLNYNLFAADGHYRVSYFADVTDNVLDSCTSPWVLLTAEASGVGFTCETFFNTPTNNFTVADPTGNQTVTVSVDNGNNLPLVYEYFLVGANGVETLIFTSASSPVDGNYAQAIARNLFAPGGNVGNYNMRVRVTDSSAASVPVFCDMFSPARYIVGAVNANISVEAYGGGRLGFEVGECFNITNSSVTNIGTQFGSAVTNLLYQWTIGGGGNPANNNQSGVTVFTNFEPFSPDPLELCFYENGTYTMDLRARNDHQGDTTFLQENTETQNIRVCDSQGLSVQSLTNFNAGVKSFTVNFFGELTGNYTFTITNTDTATVVAGPTAQASNIFSQNLPAGNYRLDVSRGGCLGVASASYNFSLIGAGGIAASYRFLNNINAGTAPLTVCFIDTSTTNGGSLNSWAWDFEPFVPDGTYEITAPGTQNPCFVFTVPGVYRPRLRVGNTSGQFATAQNPVRVYSVLEGQMSFTAAPSGGGAWCFTPDMSGAPLGTQVNFWEFDANEQPTPTQTPAVGVNGSGVICHTYGSSGTYYVNMCFTGPSPTFETGCVTRPVIVDLPGNNPPTLTTTEACSLTGTAAFSVTNTGPSNMPNSVTVVFYNNGVEFNSTTIQLNNGATQNFSFTGMAGVVQMVIGAYGVNVSTTCSYPPILSISAVCSATSPSYPEFTLTNANEPLGDNPMLVTQPFTVFNGATPVHTGNLPILPDGVSSQVIPITWAGTENPYATYRIETNGTYGSIIFSPAAPCNPAPVITVTRSCANPTQFTINSTLPLFMPQSFEVVGTGITGIIPAGAGGTPLVVNLTGLDPYASYQVRNTTTTQGFVTFDTVLPVCAAPTLDVVRTCANPTQITINASAPLAVDQGFEVVGNPAISGVITAGTSTVTLTLTGLDPYGAYQVTSNGSPNGFITYTSISTSCTRPDLVITHDCANPVTFTVINNGGDMLMPSTVNYVTGGGSISPTTVQLVNGASEVITVSPATLDPYAAYEININDFNTNSVAVVATRDCLDPVLSVTNNTCATYPLTFTVTNTGGTMAVGQLYEIRNSANVVVLSGTLNVVGAGGSQLITMTGINPYDTYTITSTGFAGGLSGSVVNACTAPVLSAVSTCGYPATFTISNTGGDMITSQTFTVTHKDGSDVTGAVTPAPNTFDINNGQTVVVTLAADSDPYGLYTLTSTGFAGGVTHTQDCELPRLQVTSSCLFPVQFLVRNVGAPMLVDHSFTVTNTLGFDLTPAPGLFNLATDEVYLVDIPVTDLSLTITFASNTYGIFNTTQVTCISGGGVTQNPIVDLGDPLSPTITPISMETVLLNRLSTDVLGLPAWSGVPTCGHGCPIFRLYHTNQSGDWDIWRLDGADMDNEVSFHTNLTELDSVDGGNAENVVDISPSLSPNNDYFVFSSDRDGNWEIYVAPTDGDLNNAQRVTFNETAIDTDPTWGPNNYIVYESSRNGNWDLVMVNVTTGVEYQLTDSPSNEMNPAWSPDGSKILYQSDVNSSPLIVDWQVFELDLTTMTVRRLTTEEFGAVDPAYSPDGNRIVYRTHTAMTNSVIKVMNGNLSGNVAVTSTIENATTPVFSPSGRYLAYQSNADGDLDIYVHEFASGLTRKLTDNTIDDFAPTWLCGDDRLVFTSEIYGNPDIFEVDVEPITASPILVEEDAFQLTFEEFDDVYPMMNQPEENASREDQKVMEDTQYQRGIFRTGFSMTPQDSSVDFGQREDWAELNVCPASDFAIGGGG